VSERSRRERVSVSERKSGKEEEEGKKGRKEKMRSQFNNKYHK